VSTSLENALTAATLHAVNSLLRTTFRWRFSHIRQPAQEEGWIAAEIWRDVRLESVMGTKADVRRPLQIYGFTPKAVTSDDKSETFLE
jgi:hypothetical protein